MHGIISLKQPAYRSAEQLCEPTWLSEPLSIFHERWWLDAVAPNSWGEVTAEKAGNIIARFPFYRTQSFGFSVLGMPPFTRTLGPWIAAIDGKAVTRREREIHLVSELIEKLPKHTFFRQLLPPSHDNLLAFQNAGFCIGIEHTIEIDCRSSAEHLWNGLHHKTRSLIRRAAKEHRFEVLTDPDEFCKFYQHNMMSKGQALDFNPLDFVRLYQACNERNACAILALRHPQGGLSAAIFLVWWAGRMHFLLQTRDPLLASAGSIECLIWKGIESAVRRSLVFDLDGIPNERTAHRLLPFGGEIRARTIVTRGSVTCMTLRQFKKSFAWRTRQRSAAFC
jgi:Acetyltransferase (GNAT) domain